MRVLAVAEKNSDSYADPGADGFTLLGLIGLTDPPRSEAKESIAIARRAGIRVVMLTGDQIETGRAIARQLGIGDGEPRARHGRGLDAETDDQLPDRRPYRCLCARFAEANSVCEGSAAPEKFAVTCVAPRRAGANADVVVSWAFAAPKWPKNCRLVCRCNFAPIVAAIILRT